MTFKKNIKNESLELVKKVNHFLFSPLGTEISPGGKLTDQILQDKLNIMHGLFFNYIEFQKAQKNELFMKLYDLIKLFDFKDKTSIPPHSCMTQLEFIGYDYILSDLLKKCFKLCPKQPEVSRLIQSLNLKEINEFQSSQLLNIAFEDQKKFITLLKMNYILIIKKCEDVYGHRYQVTY